MCVEEECKRNGWVGLGGEERVEAWPLQDPSFVHSVILHWSILFLAFDTFIAPPLVVFCNRDCAIYSFPPAPLCCHSPYTTDHGNIV